jgi:hypothetical protein
MTSEGGFTSLDVVVIGASQLVQAARTLRAGPLLDADPATGVTTEGRGA